MDLWTLVIVILAFSLAFGPILSLKPSPRDRRQEKLRARASAYQLHVSLKALPRQATDMEAPQRTPCYSYNHPRGRGAACWLLVRGSYEHERQFLGWWRWQGKARPSEEEQAILQEWLPQLPPSVVAVGANTSGCYAYWNEHGDEPVLEQLGTGLRRLRDCTRPRASNPD